MTSTKQSAVHELIEYIKLGWEGTDAKILTLALDAEKELTTEEGAK